MVRERDNIVTADGYSWPDLFDECFLPLELECRRVQNWFQRGEKWDASRHQIGRLDPSASMAANDRRMPQQGEGSGLQHCAVGENISVKGLPLVFIGRAVIHAPGHSEY